MFSLTTDLLRDPDTLVEHHDDDAALARLAPPLLGIAAAGAAVFGLAVGSYTGVGQSLYAALKMPLLLVPPMLTLPVLVTVTRACGVPVSWRRLAVVSLAAMARTGILAAALAPALWLPFSTGLDYHVAVVMFVAALGAVGLPGLAAVARAIPRGGEGRWLASIGAVALLCVVFAQTGWLLRPFVARPTTEPTLFRPVESDVFSALGATVAASLGLYQDWDAAPAGFVRTGLTREVRR